jgi:hypothetical protein
VPVLPFFFLILVSITLVIKTRDTNCVVVLVVDLVSYLIEKRSSLGLSDCLREERVERDPIFVTTSTGSRFARTEPR